MKNIGWIILGIVTLGVGYYLFKSKPSAKAGPETPGAQKPAQPKEPARSAVDVPPVTGNSAIESVSPRITIAVDLGLQSGANAPGGTLWVKPAQPSDWDKFSVGDNIILNGGTYKDVSGKVVFKEDNKTAGKLIHIGGFTFQGKQLVQGTLTKA